jgi:hypothetical protein
MKPPSRARLFHLADLLAGHLRGNPCPNCRGKEVTRIVTKHLGLGSIYRCQSCALYFRPTGLQTGRVARWYYSTLYRDQGIATAPLTGDREAALVMAQQAGKDRSSLIETVLPLLPEEERRIGVLGASWGYELLCLERLGLPLYGVEPGDARREHGRARFGLDLHPTPEAAAAAGHHGGVVFSSHVLEHIPALDDALDAIEHALAPALQVHLTPRVEPPIDDFSASIGREHPLGVTEAFWRRRADRTAMHLVALGAHRPSPDERYCETLAILQRRPR